MTTPDPVASRTPEADRAVLLEAASRLRLFAQVDRCDGFLRRADDSDTLAAKLRQMAGETA